MTRATCRATNCFVERAQNSVFCRIHREEIAAELTAEPAVPAVDMVNHPPHYRRGPKVKCPNCDHSWQLECIAVIRWIKDFRLATAMKYLWRVAFGGKADDREDIGKAVWYQQDWLDNDVNEHNRT